MIPSVTAIPLVSTPKALFYFTVIFSWRSWGVCYKSKHRCQMTPVFSKDLNLSINHLKLSVLSSVGHLHTQVFQDTVFLNGIREIKRNHTFIVLRVFYLVWMTVFHPAYESWLGCILSSVYPLVNTDSNRCCSAEQCSLLRLEHYFTEIYLQC